MSEKTGSPTDQQQQDLNPTTMTGQNESVDGQQPEKDAQKPKSSLEKYCDDNPSASECLIYDEWIKVKPKQPYLYWAKAVWL